MSTYNKNKTFIQTGLRLIVLMVLSITLGQSVFADVGSNWIEQFGITWTFDKNLSTDGAGDTYQYGTFVNGDYWVVGPVDIISISPPSTNVAGVIKNGSMINPVAADDQAYDNRSAGYNTGKNVALDVSSENPLTITVASSLISCISLPEQVGKLWIDQAAVLTILEEIPPANSFRPPYSGSNKSIRATEEDIDRTKLSNRPKPAGALSYDALVTNVQMDKGPWIVHWDSWHSTYIHPIQNMNWYGTGFALRTGEAALALNLDYTPEEKEPILINYLQLGIDFYGVIEAGDIFNWMNNGGIFHGRKIPILFAGIVLQKADMLAIGEKSGDYLYTSVDQNGYPNPTGPSNPPVDYIYFQEDDQTFYVTQYDYDITNDLVPDYPWSPDPTDNNFPFRITDIGMPEWGLRHATKPWITSRTILSYRPLNSCTYAATILAAHMMGMKEYWNHDALFDYTDRWVAWVWGDPPDPPLPDEVDETQALYDSLKKTPSAWVWNAWFDYRDDFPPVWPNAGSDTPDTTPPDIVSVTVNSPVQVLFSEPLDEASAANVSNYMIEPGITISSATLEDDLRTVILTTSDHSQNVDYTLTVNGVMDVNGNSMVDVPHTYRYSSTAIIIDHTALEQFDQIPDYWINEVKKMYLYYPGESHSSGMLSGLRLVEQQDSRFHVSISRTDLEADTDEYLRVFNNQVGEQNSWTNQPAINNLNTYLQTNDFEVFVFGWCWDMIGGDVQGGVDPVFNTRWAGWSEGGPDGNLSWGLDAEDSALTGNSVSLQNYLDAWDYYEQNNPDMAIVYSTGPVDYVGEMGYQRYLKHEGIRDWVNNDQDRILFDYGDILTYNNAGEQASSIWDGHTYPSEHPENDGDVDPFGYGKGHLGEEGYLKIGKAMWVLLARISGWDGTQDGAGNQTPTANAGVDQTVTDTDNNGSEQVALDGSGSSDPDGTIQTYVWREGLNQVASGINPTITLSTGTHTITLTVTDDLGASNTDTVAIIIEDSNLDQTYYVSESGAGNRNGVDWNNAYAQLPANLERGYVYYISDGKYDGYAFNDLGNDGNFIYIKKAVSNDHGTSIGWLSEYGDGIAEFGPLDFESDNYVFDGQHKYGFKVVGEYTGRTIDLNSNYVFVLNTDIDGNFQTNASGYHIDGSCSVIYIYGSYVTLENCDIHNAADDGIGVYGNNITIKGNEIHNLHAYGTDGGTGPCSNGHSDAFELQNCADIEIIGNLVYDIKSTSALITGQWSAGNYTRNLTLYNNIFYTPDIGMCVYIYYVQGAQIYNNVFWGRTQSGGLAIGPEVTDLYVQNNIILDINYTHLGGVYDPLNHHIDYNLFGTIEASQYTANAHDFVGDPLFKDIPMSSDRSAHLTNVVIDNFALQSNSPAINRGIDLSAQVQETSDIVGTPRPQGSAWDIGPYEYTNDNEPGNQAPTSDAGVNQTITDIDGSGSEQIVLDGSGSSDPDGTIQSYIWREGTTEIATGVNPIVTLNTGIHTVALTVTDDGGLTDIDTVTITVSAKPDDTGIVAWWKFDEGSGNIAQDSSGNSNTGTLYGSTWASGGRLYFDGADDAVEVPTMNWNAASGTIAILVNAESFSNTKHFLFGHATQPWSNRIQLYCNSSGGLTLGLGDNSSLHTNIQDLSPNQWYHVALIWDSGNYTVYIDGIEKAIGMYTGLNTLNAFADIGNNGNISARSEAFAGLIDDVRIYNRALAANEVAALYDEGTATSPDIDRVTTPFESIIELWFNEPFGGLLTEDPNDYTVNNEINVHKVSLDADNNRVRLFTDVHDTGTDYTLNIAGFDTSVNYTYDNGLIGNWALDEYSGTEAQDSSGNGNTAILQNGPEWTTQGGVSLDGGDDAVEIPTTGLKTSSGTISLWAYANNYSGEQYFFGHTLSDANNIKLYAIGDQLCAHLGSTGVLITNLNLVAGVWYNLALTWDGTNYSVYVDGVEEVDGEYSGLTTLNSYADIGNIGLASSRDDAAFDGLIGDVRMYNRAYSAAEIQDLYLTYQVNENRQLVLETTEQLAGGSTITYQLQNSEDLPDGATFNDSDGTVTWRPWYDQAGAFELTFVENGQPENTKTYTVVANNITPASWYRTWLQANEKL